MKNSLSTGLLSSRIARICVIVFLLFSALGESGCKSKKKLLEEQQAREAAASHQAKIDKTKAFLTALLNNDEGKSLEQREREFASIKRQKWEDPEVLALIEKVEAQLAAERRAADEAAAKAKAEAEARAEEVAKNEAKDSIEEELMTNFGLISTSGSLATSNSTIERTLSLFSSGKAPVLIIINENRNDIDYDKPTTISKYLQYLKDQKKPADKIKEISYDRAGKISELILTKD